MSGFVIINYNQIAVFWQSLQKVFCLGCVYGAALLALRA